MQFGLLEVLATADVVTFLVSDGRTTERPKPKTTLSLKELFDAYFAAVPEGHLEETTLATMRQHVKQLYTHFGEDFSV